MAPSHPREAEAWEWDEGNEAELARHAISATEVEQVWENGPVFVPNRRHRAGDWKMLGLTHGGRRLTIVIRYFQERRTIRPITGWPTTDGEKSRYFKGD
jgi:uncharacterized DUF497 family protein